MRIRLGTLKRILSEVALSPSVFTNNKRINAPLDKPNLAKAFHELSKLFKSTLEMDLILSMANKYNKETREFDDAAFEQVKQACNSATENLEAQVNSSLTNNWASAHKGTGETS